MRNGIRWIAFMAFNALLDVSLKDHYQFQGNNKKKKVNSYERHHNVVITLSANSYTTFCTFSGAVLAGDSKNWDSVADI